MFEQCLAATTDLLNTVTRQRTITQKPTLVLGLSGGPDSVFLLHVLHKLYTDGVINLIAAHLDHGWRTDSKNDASFCSLLCLKMNIPLVTAHAHDLSVTVKNNGSKEDAGRQLRRFFLEQTLQQHKAHFIALAHHQNDQQETFFMRMLRGATLDGLGCMNTADGIYMRPLLHVSKQDILSFLDTNNIPYVIDPSNDTDSFLRNRIRKHVIPALAACDDRFDQKFQTTLQLLKEEANFLKRLTLQTFKQTFTYDYETNVYTGDLQYFMTVDPVLQRRVVMHWLIQEKVTFAVSTAFINEIIRFLQSPAGGSHIVGPSITIIKKQQTMWLTREPAQQHSQCC